MPIQKRFRPTGHLVLYYFIIVFLSSCNKPGARLIEVTSLNDYPSGSGLAYLDKHLYIIGDDAAGILKTDSLFTTMDSTALFVSNQKRIPKETKADLESMALIRLNKTGAFLLPGSGSLEPQRNVCWIVDPANGQKQQYQLDTFYNRIKTGGIRELNIEGAAAIPSGIVLASRGNKSFAKNYLVFTANRFWEKQGLAPIRIVKTGTNTDTSSFAGISGLDYSYKTDQLLLTVSTENTYNSYEDGGIGKSYLWIINDISSKKRLVAMNPDRIIDLEELDARFKGHKIESVCIVSENKKEKELVLVADDDKGKTVLFRMIL